MGSSQRPILFVSTVGSGLINTLLVLADELSRRGVEDLWFAADEERRGEVEKIASGTPVEFFSLGEMHPDDLSENWDDETYRAVTQRSRFKARKAIIEKNNHPRQRIPKYRKLEEAVEKIQPAVMVIDCMCKHGIELAITKKIPYVLNVPFLPSNVLVSYVPFGKSYAPKSFPCRTPGCPTSRTWCRTCRTASCSCVPSPWACPRTCASSGWRTPRSARSSASPPRRRASSPGSSSRR